MAAVAAAVSLLLPMRYTASTTILPPQQGSSASAGLLSQLGNLGSVASLAGGGLGGLKNPNDLQVAMLKSRTVEDAMVDRFHLVQMYHRKLQSDARKKFESFVDIDNGSKDGLSASPSPTVTLVMLRRWPTGTSKNSRDCPLPSLSPRPRNVDCSLSNS